MYLINIELRSDSIEISTPIRQTRKEKKFLQSMHKILYEKEDIDLSDIIKKDIHYTLIASEGDYYIRKSQRIPQPLGVQLFVKKR